MTTNGTDGGPRNAQYKETTNLSFAAYLYMRGLQIVRATERRGRGNVEYAFGFADPDDQWDAFNFDFANSESARFDNAVRMLKQLCRRNAQSD